MSISVRWVNKDDAERIKAKEEMFELQCEKIAYMLVTQEYADFFTPEEHKEDVNLEDNEWVKYFKI